MQTAAASKLHYSSQQQRLNHPNLYEKAEYGPDCQKEESAPAYAVSAIELNLA